MDLQTSLICLGVFAASAIVVYLISVLGMREKTYEEAIAEQRLKGEDILMPRKAEVKPAKDKKHKKSQRKNREKSDKSGDFESELHVGFKSEAEIIPDEETETKKSTKDTRKADEPRSILINKKEKTPPSSAKEEAKAVKKQNSAERNDAESRAPVAAPAKENKQQAEKKESSPTKKDERKTESKEKRNEAGDFKAEREKKREGSNEKEELQNEITMPKEQALKADESKFKDTNKEDILNVAQAPKSSSPTRKVKKGKTGEEALNSTRLASLIKASVLSQTEIHSLIEALLNKQQAEIGGTEWLKIGQKMDPMSALRKQLQEKEELLNEERQRAQTTGNKLKELRQEFNTDKSRYNQMERQHQQEIQNLRLQLQRITSQRSEETSSIQKLKEENNRLGLAMTQVETENGNLQIRLDALTDNVNQMECQRVETEEYTHRLRELESQVNNFEAEKAALLTQLQNSGIACGNLDEERAKLQREYAKLQNELKTHEATRKQANDLIEDLTQQKSSLEKQLSTLKIALTTNETSQKQLNDLIESLKMEKNSLEKEILNAQNQIQDLHNKLTKSDNEITALKVDNELLATQLSKVTEREEAEGQEGTGDSLPRDKTNGHVQLEECGDHKKIPLTEHEHILHEKENLVSQLTTDLKEKTREVQDLYKQISDFTETISRLTTDLETQKEKNNALREKNWKVMEALKNAEKLQSDGVKQAENLTNEKFLNRLKDEQKLYQDVLERIFPTIRIEKSAGYSEWISQFEKRAHSCLQEAQEAKMNNSAENELRSKLEVSDESCTKLQAQVQHYKTSLLETEGILKKIQGSVEEEELKWREKLESKEQQLQKLLQEKKSYEASLEQVRAAEEMQGKLRELQEKLQTEETEKRTLDGRRLEIEKEASSLRDQLKQSEDQLQQCKLDRENISEQSKETDILKQQLEKERQSYKELNAQNVKLNSLVKIGQDALRAEQELVKSLQLKLESSNTEQVSSTNGPPIGDQSPASEFRCFGVEVCPNPNFSAADASSAVSSDPQPSPAQSTSTLVASKKSKNKKRVALGKK